MIPEGYGVIALGSQNGTYVNGDKIGIPFFENDAVCQIYQSLRTDDIIVQRQLPDGRWIESKPCPSFSHRFLFRLLKREQPKEKEMKKYIVSLEIPLGSNDPKAYSHEAVKQAYKAGAVVEFLLYEKWTKIFYPAWYSDGKYRAIVTPDMPEEIQKLVNYIGDKEIVQIPYNESPSGNKPMKWADVIIAMANGETGQWLHANGKWTDGVGYNPMANPEYEWRIKPKTIKIGDMEVPEPLRVAPEAGMKYYIADPNHEDLFDWNPWDGGSCDLRYLNRGLAHATQDAAIAHAKALIKISGGK